MREVEIKLKAPNLVAIEQKLKELGAAISEPIAQEDINFVHRDDTKWFESNGGDWLYPRLRITDTGLKFTVKKPLLNEMDCIEHEIKVDDAEEVKAIMEMFGYVRGVTVKKVRRTCEYGPYTITLDKVEGLGSFIEIERVVEDGDAEAMQEEMFAFAKDLFGLERDATVMKGYDIMMHYAGQSV